MLIVESAARVRRAISAASQGLVGRSSLCELVALAAVAKEHLLVIGPPGTAKSEAVRRVAGFMGANTFEYLLGRFTEPSELFGPVDLLRLREGRVEVRTEGMLPEAEFAFLDEVFLGSTAILNTLLGILADRSFRKGHTKIKVPLRVCVGASNSIPEEPALAAFADRFVLRCWVDSVGDASLEHLMEGGWNLTPVTEPLCSVSDVDVLHQACLKINVKPIQPDIAYAVRLLRREGFILSDRRVVKLQKLAAAAAVLDGRTVVDRRDLWTLIYAIPEEHGQRKARELLAEWMSEGDNSALIHAAAEACLGPAARSRRIVERAASELSQLKAPLNAPQEMRVEAFLREIDAGFSAETMPEGLRDLRARLRGLVER